MFDCEEEDGDCPYQADPRYTIGDPGMEWGCVEGCVTIEPLEDESSYDSDNFGDGDLSEGESGEDNQDVEEV